MRKVWVGESEVQSHPQPLCEFKASLGCMKSCLKGEKKEGGTERGRSRGGRRKREKGDERKKRERMRDIEMDGWIGR